MHCEGLRESCFFSLRGGLAAWLCQGGTVEREGMAHGAACSEPVPNCSEHTGVAPARISGAPSAPPGLHCALPCLPGPGALAGIRSMKETENVSIETQEAKSAKENKVPLSRGHRDWDCWLGFCSANPILWVLTHSHIRRGLRLWRRQEEGVHVYILPLSRQRIQMHVFISA